MWRSEGKGPLVEYQRGLCFCRGCSASLLQGRAVCGDAHSCWGLLHISTTFPAPQPRHPSTGQAHQGTGHFFTSPCPCPAPVFLLWPSPLQSSGAHHASCSPRTLCPCAALHSVSALDSPRAWRLRPHVSPTPKPQKGPSSTAQVLRLHHADFWAASTAPPHGDIWASRAPGPQPWHYPRWVPCHGDQR